MANKMITIRYKKSTIGCTEQQIATVRGLGLKRLGQKRELPNTPEVRGMIKKVIHLVSVEKEE